MFLLVSVWGLLIWAVLFCISQRISIRLLSKIYGIFLFISFLCNVTLSFDLLFNNIIFYWNLGSFKLECFYLFISISFIVDSLTIFFHSILLVALVVCFYFLIEYFEYEFNGKSIILLSLLFSNLAYLFFSSNDIFLLISFWEYISIVSFLLVQYWTQRISTIKAALKVFCISQIGDIFFFFSLFLSWFIFENSNISCMYSLFFLINFFSVNIVFNVSINSVIAFGFVIALFLKSAQFIFFPWLLDAMEAPVPISAQLHSSTLVIIGFYLIFRFFYLIIINESLLYLLFIFGFLTTVSSSILGFFQTDGKKLLACSTASQLGYVVISISLQLYSESLLLLAFCCCNKALVFVWFGKIIDKNNGISDLRLLKNSCLSIFEKSGLLVSILSSTIIPGSFGWHIKGLISRGLLVYDSGFMIVGLAVLSITWFLTSLYLLKLYVYIYNMPALFFLKNYNKNTLMFNFFTTKVGINFFFLFIVLLQLFVFGFSLFYFMLYFYIVLICLMGSYY